MQYLNIIYFVIISWYGYKFLKSDGAEVPSVMIPNAICRYSGPELFWCLTFSTGLLALSANVGLDLMAIRLGVLELLCIIGLKTTSEKPIWNTPMIVYALYLVWLLVGCFYGPSVGYGIRVTLKYMYPFLLCLFASAAVSDAEVFFKSSLLARRIALIALICAFIPFSRYIIPGVFWYGTAKAINFISIMIFSLAMFYMTEAKRKNLLFAIVFIIPCFIWVFRTSIMGSTLAIMVFFLYKYKLKALPCIFGILIVAITLVFTIPSVREKMFYDSDNKNSDMLYNNELSMSEVNSNGRFAMWEWSLEKFWEPEIMTGSGTGNLQKVFYELRHPFGSIKICHNDYVQILCDNGLIGIILFGSSFLLIIIHCFSIFNTGYYTIPIRICAITAGASLAGMMLTMYTDNVVNYSMATLSMPLGFYGMTLGMVRKFDLTR